MDKYEFNIKVEQIRKLVNKGDYETAIKIADGIDWRRVHNANLLSMISQVYEKNKEYGYAKDILLMAFERAPVGKRLLYKLTELAIREGSLDEAEDYYREFCDLAGDDPRQHLLRYMLLRAKDAPVEQLIHTLERYCAEELDERWLYELAELYHEAGDEAKCVAACDKLMLMFGLGKYVDKAMDLKLQYAPLSKYQMDLVENREKYEEKLRAVEQSYQDVDGREEEEEPEEPRREPESRPAEPERRPAEPVYETAPADAVVKGAPEPVEVLPEPEEEAESDSLPTPEVSYEPEAVEAAMRQAETEASLAQEMSRMKPGSPEEGSDEMGKTRIVKDIRRSRPAVVKAPAQEAEEPVRETTSRPRHVMVEARTPEKGMEAAILTLKRIRRESGVKNPVIKITGSKLNKRGVLASAEKLAGKDLMIEEAGDLSVETIEELEQLMSRDHTGMRVVLIDNPKQMKILAGKSSSLSDWFEYVQGDELVAGEHENPPAGAGKPEAAPARPAEKQAEPPVQPAPEKPAASAAKQVASAAKPVAGEDDPEAAAADGRPVRRVFPVKDTAMRAPEPSYEPVVADPNEEMDIDEFAQYACQYAADIDCSITGKSMLALYERIEIMEEDGIKLTRANAEDLIEEAADRAEKPSLGKRIKGMFSSKYDKDGLLILKEEHFIG